MTVVDRKNGNNSVIQRGELGIGKNMRVFIQLNLRIIVDCAFLNYTYLQNHSMF